MKKTLFLIAITLLSACTIPPNQVDSSKSTKTTQPTASAVLATASPQATEISQVKFDLTQDVCTQITAEFVEQTTGITIKSTKVLSDNFINTCDYYLTEEANSPYIAIIVNKNMQFEKHKQIDAKNKMEVQTDPDISGNHYVAWKDNHTRIVHINLYLDENNFLRIDKNVERAIDNEGMLKLASAISKKL